MILKVRNPKTGTFTKAPPERTLKALDTFGQSLVKRGKSILKRSNKVASGTLIDSYHYKLIPIKSGFELQFGFGSASKYWRFIDEGVQGVGGAIGSGGFCLIYATNSSGYSSRNQAESITTNNRRRRREEKELL